MINEDKPAVGVPETDLDIGSGYNLIVGGVYTLVIGAVNVLAGLTNSSKVSVGETWESNPYAWAAETRTWLAVSQLIGNETKISSSITNISKP
jgi:hypothetical protein